MLDRLRFKFNPHSFMYNEKTGQGYVVRDYYICTDTVRLRTSKFGYVTGVRLISRRAYFKLIASLGQDNLEMAARRMKLEAEARRVHEDAEAIRQDGQRRRDAMRRNAGYRGENKS